MKRWLPVLIFFGLALPTVSIGSELVTVKQLQEAPESYHLRLVTLKGVARDYRKTAGGRLFTFEDETGAIDVAINYRVKSTKKGPPVGEKVLLQVQVHVLGDTHPAEKPPSLGPTELRTIEVLADKWWLMP